MVAERPLYVPRKCNASFLLSGVCGGTLRLEVAERFVLRIIQIAIVEHTVVDPSYQGLGLAGDLATAFFSYCIELGLRVRPMCSYIVTYLKRHPELQDMVVQ